MTGTGICLGDALDVREEIASPSNDESHSPDEEPEGQPISKIKVSIGNSRHKMDCGEEAPYLESVKPRLGFRRFAENRPLDMLLGLWVVSLSHDLHNPSLGVELRF